jgi:hypothetical protein
MGRRLTRYLHKSARRRPGNYLHWRKRGARPGAQSVLFLVLRLPLYASPPKRRRRRLLHGFRPFGPDSKNATYFGTCFQPKREGTQKGERIALATYSFSPPQEPATRCGADLFIKSGARQIRMVSATAYVTLESLAHTSVLHRC